MGVANFKILHKSGKARVGELNTPHGTQATVKALSPKDLKEIGAQIVLANTYHLMLRPGADLVQKMGGLHMFMSWDKPLMNEKN